MKADRDASSGFLPASRRVVIGIIGHFGQEPIDAAVSRLTRQSLTPFTQAPREIAWRSTPASYIVCTEDLATPAETQRRRIRDGVRRVEFDAGHHPFLSRPEAFAEVLAEEIRFSTTAAD